MPINFFLLISAIIFLFLTSAPALLVSEIHSTGDSHLVMSISSGNDEITIPPS